MLGGCGDGREAHAQLEQKAGHLLANPCQTIGVGSWDTTHLGMGPRVGFRQYGFITCLVPGIRHPVDYVHLPAGFAERPGFFDQPWVGTQVSGGDQAYAGFGREWRR